MKVVYENSVPSKFHYADLPDMQRGMIIEARLAGASMSRASDIMGFSRTTVSKVTIAYTKLAKMSSAKQNSGRVSKLTDRDRRLLKWIVAQKDGDKKTALP